MRREQRDRHGKLKALFVVHVDDYVHAYSDASLDKKLKGKFQDLWGVRSVGLLKWYLWMEIEYVKGHHAFISQSAYFKKVLKRFRFDKMKGICTPMESTFKVTIDDAGDGPIPMFTDSTAALGMTQYKGVTHRTKHIALRYHFVKHLIDDKVVTINKVHTADNPADILTKATDAVTFNRNADLCAPRKGNG